MAASATSPQWLETTFGTIFFPKFEKRQFFFRNFNNFFLDDTTTVTGVMIQVSEVKKWIEHIEGKRDFPEENNLTHFYVTVSEKKKSLIGSAGWKKIGTFETNYKWDAEKGISYHKFDK